MSAITKSDILKGRINGTGLYWLSQLLSKTCKFQFPQLEEMQSIVAEDRPLILAGWHGISMMMVSMWTKFFGDMSNVELPMPDDWRGVALDTWGKNMKATTHPMNLKGDSTLGMAKQVLRITRRVGEGRIMYINPDGPDGPAHVPKAGVIYIARKANAAILPMGAYARHAFVVPRWDRYTVPYPFSRISVHTGEPIEELPEDDRDAARFLTDTLNKVYLQAAADYYEQG